MTDTTSQTVANVLLVDDDAENLWSLQLALESDGHHVSVAGDANCALDILCRESIQLMITDYEMPGIDGAELCRLVHEQPAHSGPGVGLHERMRRGIVGTLNGAGHDLAH